MEQPYLASEMPAAPAWSDMEHRCGDRRPANLPVRIILPPREVLLGRVRDISLSGAFVQTWRELPAMTRVVVELRSAFFGAPASRQRIAGFVVRNGATGVGIEWADFAPACVRDHWHALAATTSAATPAPKRRSLQRRVLLGRDWLVYCPAERLTTPAPAAFTDVPHEPG
jgi:hypothetical protein